MLRIDKNDYAVENCATQEFNNALDNLDRSQTTEVMIVDEIYTISLFYNRCNTEHDDF